MAKSIAGAARGSRRLAAGLCLLSWLIQHEGLAVALAQTQEPAPPPLSPACDVPASDLSSPVPMPNVSARLQQMKPLRILAIGSSSDLAYGAPSGIKSYPMRIESLLETSLKGSDIDVINRGLPGEVASTSAERIKSEVVTEMPDLVLWQVGMNDALSRVDPNEFEQTVRSTIGWLRDNHIDVALVGMQYVPRFAKDAAYYEIHDRIRRIAEDTGILYVRRYDAMRFIAKTRANQPLMMSDQFHLNDLGYQCMAEYVARAVIASVYLRKFRPAGK
ncbi:SGNH/GDSL hydrolase family protein [Beijerinckia mobilis]|uniref:SGNH/GDSL hydrolase family protein n=1 Tax=Beijerinckia mobilis TaxID=231434 RepID=UPI001FDA590F|nr:GDSL-type esterase/lipase family protein [Beijerinckia mobilis]